MKLEKDVSLGYLFPRTVKYVQKTHNLRQAACESGKEEEA